MLTSIPERDRLALLWKAFEDAEERIRDLEADLDRQRAAPPLAPSADGGVEPRALRREAERLRAQLHEREASLATLEAENGRLGDMLERERDAAERATEALRNDLRKAIAGLLRERERAKGLESLQARLDEAGERTMGAQQELAEALARLEGMETVVSTLQALVRALERDAAAGRQAKRLQAQARPAPLRPFRPLPLDTNRVSEIPGVRAEEVAALRRYGVNLADALLYADLGPLAEAAGIGLPRLWKLRALAELMSLHGIGPEWADHLYRGGVRSLADLAARDAAELEAIILAGSEPRLGEEGKVLLRRTLPGRLGAVLEEARRTLLA